jgi:hypothetical protein
VQADPALKSALEDIYNAFAGRPRSIMGETMSRISCWFFAISVLYVVIDIPIRMHMGANIGYELAPAHSHWNLLGWVGNSIYGTFFALAGANAPKRLPGIVLVLHNIGVPVMIASLALYLLNHNDRAYVPGLIAGEVPTIIAMLTFAAAVLIVLTRTTRADGWVESNNGRR